MLTYERKQKKEQVIIIARKEAIKKRKGRTREARRIKTKIKIY